MGSATYKNEVGGAQVTTRPVASMGQGGNFLPNYFLCPLNSVGLSFRIFVCIHLLCKINVSTCCVVLDCSNALNFCKFLKILHKNFQNCFIRFSNFPKVLI